MFLHMAEYCDTPQSKERRNREYKACLNERAILRLLDHDLSRNSDLLQVKECGPFGGYITSLREFTFLTHCSRFS
jgi:hypothetical protein